MSDHEDDLDGFRAEKPTQTVESSVEAYRTESTDQGTARSGNMTKILPLFAGPTSWFKYEELIDDWFDRTAPKARKRGPALKNRLVGDAAMYRDSFTEYL